MPWATDSQICTVILDYSDVEVLDRLDIFPSRGAAIRTAIREMLVYLDEFQPVTPTHERYVSVQLPRLYIDMIRMIDKSLTAVVRWMVRGFVQNLQTYPGGIVPREPVARLSAEELYRNAVR